MQPSLMFLDLKTFGAAANSQKLAIKMPGGDNDGSKVTDCAGFADIINALMSMTPEELKESLGQLDLIKVDGESSEYAPLIDISQGSEHRRHLLSVLFGQTEAEINQQSNPLGMKGGASNLWDNQATAKIGSAVESAEKESASLLDKKALGGDGLASETRSRIDIDLKTGEVAFGKTADASHPSVKGVELLSRSEVDQFNSDLGSATADTSDEASVAPVGQDAAGSPKANTRGLGHLQNYETSDLASISPFEQQPGDPYQKENNAYAKQETKDQLKFGFNAPKPGAEQIEGLMEKGAESEDAIKHVHISKSDATHPTTHRTNATPSNGVEHLSGNEEWIPDAKETQSNIIRQIVQRMTLRARGSESTMSIKLKPEFLGNLHMQVTTDHQQVIVRMAAESAAVKEMIEQGLQHLKTELQQHGLEINKFDVFVANDNGEAGHGHDSPAFQQALKQRQQKRMNKLPNAGEKRHQTGTIVQGRDNLNEIDYFV